MNEVLYNGHQVVILKRHSTWTVHVGTETTQGKLTVLSQKMGGSILW